MRVSAKSRTGAPSTVLSHALSRSSGRRTRAGSATRRNILARGGERSPDARAGDEARADELALAAMRVLRIGQARPERGGDGRGGSGHGRSFAVRRPARRGATSRADGAVCTIPTGGPALAAHA